MKRSLLSLGIRALQTPLPILARRVVFEARGQMDRIYAPKRLLKFKTETLLQETGQKTIAELWECLAAKEFFCPTDLSTGVKFKHEFPHLTKTIINRAELAEQHTVDLLGSGPVNLGKHIDWCKDFKTDIRWPNVFFADIEYNNLELPSDVKVPWELSRMQWLIPVGMAYLLTSEEKYGRLVKEELLSWIQANPYGFSVNWSCTMEVALRIVTWTWFFHVFNSSESWQDTEFQDLFLRTLWLHGEFTSRHLEYAFINGNHYTADAAGLVFSGLFFGGKNKAAKWLDNGVKILEREILNQVSDDGVDFEGSIPYQRLITELFLYPAMFLTARGYKISRKYRDRLQAMADFIRCYSQPDGNCPLIGDADDGRMLPFGTQHINNHLYLVTAVQRFLSGKDYKPLDSDSDAEIFWLFGNTGGMKVCDESESKDFALGGYYVMRHQKDYVFIDCAPIGTGGRGGHGHNDCLSFEAVLMGKKVITDSGAFIYTADYKARNLFRSTGSHNTPIVNKTEINRFIKPEYLWDLTYDAKPEVFSWKCDAEYDYLKAGHQGYRKLHPPVGLIREFLLQKGEHQILIHDLLRCENSFVVEFPFHIAPDLKVEKVGLTTFKLYDTTHTSFLHFKISGNEGNVDITCSPTKISLSYGRTLNSTKIVVRFQARTGELLTALTVAPAMPVVSWIEVLKELEG